MKSRGKILRIKTGYNPNSSSIGINIGPLLIIGSLLTFMLPLISIYIVRKIRKKNDEKNNNNNIGEDK